MCRGQCLCTYAGSPPKWKGCQNFLKIELHAVLSLGAWVLAIELESSGKVATLLTTETSFHSSN